MDEVEDDGVEGEAHDEVSFHLNYSELWLEDAEVVEMLSLKQILLINCFLIR